MDPVRETYTFAGAKRLAGIIEAYWRKRGAVGVKAWPQELENMPRTFGVVSNLRGGLPPTKAAA